MKKAIKWIMIGIIILLSCLVIYGIIMITINFNEGKQEIDNNIENWESLQQQIEEQYKYH